MPETFEIRAIGHVESPLTSRADAPKQGDEGAPDAWLVFDHDVEDGLLGLETGTDLLLLTWLHEAERDLLIVHPRGDPARPPTGVFSTRSPVRPNPIGLHRVTVRAIDGRRVLVGPLEAIHGTPIIDLKPVLTDER